MRQYDAVELRNDTDELREKGIVKGTVGVLLSRVGGAGRWFVLFYNPRDEGDYAAAPADERDLRVLGPLSPSISKEVETIVARADFWQHTAFTPTRFREYDLVELSRDRPAYAREGVTKGMRGCVMSEKAVKGRQQVVFSEDDTGRDVADLMVAESDLLLVER